MNTKKEKSNYKFKLEIMTKNEKIKEAYGELYERFLPQENGWSTKFIYDFNNEYDFNLYDTNAVGHGVYSVRPKSLQGIENNNWWIKIENEDNLPKQDGLYFLYSDGGIGMGRFCELQHTFKTFNGNVYTEVTHYQQIIKPETPIY